MYASYNRFGHNIKKYVFFFKLTLRFIEPELDKTKEKKRRLANEESINLVELFSTYRDCTIITILDTCTSLLSGVITFGILGNLAYESNTDDIQSVVKGGPGLAFISYPDAVAKFQRAPQVGKVMCACAHSYSASRLIVPISRSSQSCSS